MDNLPFGKKNYQLMILGMVVLIVGFTLMSLDTQPFGFGFLGLTLSPIIILTGFIIEFFAILHRPVK